MKTLRRFFLVLPFFAFLCLFSGCRAIVVTMLQLKDPAWESDKAVQAYMKKKDISAGNTYRADSSLLVPFNQCFIILPNALVFNSKNELVDIGYPGLGKAWKENPVNCAPEFEEVMKRMCNGVVYPTVEKPNADRLLKKMYDFEGRTALETVEKDYDYLVIAGWAKYMGGFNKKVLNWERALQAQNGCRIKVLMLNTDPKPEWGYNWSGLKDSLFMHLKNQPL